MNLKTGHLYKINKFFWLLYPTKEVALAVEVAMDSSAAAVDSAFSAVMWSSHLSTKLSCNISFLNEGDSPLVVKVSGRQVKVINQEGLAGWINFPADVPVHVPAIVDVTNRARAQKISRVSQPVDKVNKQNALCTRR